MPRKRKPENNGLPTRWKFVHGAYYYIPHPELRGMWDNKSWFWLGKTLTDAWTVFLSRTQAPVVTHTIGQLLDRYSIETIPTKATKTQIENRRQVKMLRLAFGDMDLRDIEPQHIYQYISKRTAKVAAKREIEVLSHAFTKAVEWGVIKAHPFKGEVRIEGETPRDRYVEDWEVVEALSLKPKRKKGSLRLVQAYIRLKLIIGQRKGDMLRIMKTSFKEDGLHVRPRKTRNKTPKLLIFEWTPELRAAIDEAIDACPALSHYLFCNKFGEPLFDDEKANTKGFDKLWESFMARVLAETKVTERFTEHDLRAKVGSDSPTLAKAQQILAHADPSTTSRVYRRRPERINTGKNQLDN